MNRLLCGDNLEILRTRLAPASVDLCYIDPPFHSDRNYNHAYDPTDDHAASLAFTDIWRWDAAADHALNEIVAAATPQLREIAKGFHAAFGQGGFLAYLLHMTQRAVEIHRILKPDGSFYLHCDPTASHYLKVLLDAIFIAQGGQFQNEIIWSYQTGGASRQRFARKHDVILFYTKSQQFTFNAHAIREPRTEKSMKRAQTPTGARLAANNTDKLPTDVFHIPALNPMAVERLGYPTQKPEALLERLILAASNRGDLVLDACCGSGTTLAVAQRLGRQWIGIDKAQASIDTALRRIEKSFGLEVVNAIARD